MIRRSLVSIFALALLGCPPSPPPTPLAPTSPAPRAPAPAPAPEPPPVVEPPARPPEPEPVTAPPPEPPAPRREQDPEPVAAPASSEHEPRESPRARYMRIRTHELLARTTAGLPSSAIDDETLERWRALSADQADLEWRCLEDVIAEAEKLAHEQPARAAAFRAAIDTVWSVARDPAGYGEPVGRDALRQHLVFVADQVEMRQRIEGR